MMYNYDDIIHEIGLVFYRKFIINGNKGSIFPIADGEDWVIKARYILTIIDDTQIEDLFKCIEKHRLPIGLSAVWLASLLHKTSYLDRIVALMITYRGENFMYYSILGCLLAYQPSLVYKKMAAFKNQYPELEHSIDYFLQLSKQYHQNAPNCTAFPSPISTKISRKFKQSLHEIYVYHKILRGGCPISKDLPAFLDGLLCETTAPQKHALLSIKPLRPALGLIEMQTQKQLALEQYRQYGRLIPQKPIIIPKESLFTNAIKQYYFKKQPKNEMALLHALQSTTNCYDILTGIEWDDRYLISAAIIDAAFQRLQMLLNCSHQLLEQYACHLLLRGTAFDTKAAKLYGHAQVIKSRYEYRYKDGRLTRYVMALN